MRRSARVAKKKKKNRKVRLDRYWISALLAALLVAAAGLSPMPAAPPERLLVLTGAVTRVVDGDTLDVRLPSGPIRVRLHGVDTPERGQPWGKEASKALSQLTLGKVVYLEPLQQDRYDRLVAIVRTGNGDESLDVNAELVRRGHAWAYRRYMRRSADAHLCRHEHEARIARRGLWALPAEQIVAPWDWRRRRKSPGTDYVTSSAEDCFGAIGDGR